jgi:hypothetical protein
VVSGQWSVVSEEELSLGPRLRKRGNRGVVQLVDGAPSDRAARSGEPELLMSGQ